VDRIRVGVVGAGETGTPLLSRLLEAGFVELVGVADLDPEAPGMALARRRGVPTAADARDLADLGEAVDVLIDVTGAPEVRHQLRERLADSGNRHTVLVPEVVARLLMSLSEGHLVAAKHDTGAYQDAAVGVPSN
jgi:acetaldehyde dehydrogenase (acetylating)